MRALFSSPVTVWLGKAGNTRVVVNNALYAAKLLDEEWPGDPDKATQAAIVACPGPFQLVGMPRFRLRIRRSSSVSA